MLYAAAFHRVSGKLGDLRPASKRLKTLGAAGDREFEVLDLDLDPAVVAQVQAGERVLFRDGTTVAWPKVSLDEEIAAAKADGRLRFSAAGNLTLDEGALDPRRAVPLGD
jgi:hypothetical protein